MTESLLFQAPKASFFNKPKLKTVCVTERNISVDTLTLDWIKVDSLLIGKKSLTLKSKGIVVFEIPNSFGLALAQALVKWALFYDTPLFIGSDVENPHQYLQTVPKLEMV
jgi:hypothetical protein